jgi:hypothetical protein
VDTNTPGDNIRGDAHPRKPLKCLFEQLVSPLAGAPIGTDQEVIGSKLDNLFWLPPLLYSLNELGAAVDEDVLIPNSWQSQNTWGNGDGVSVMLIVSDCSIRAFGKGEHGMLHTRLVILETPRREISDEKIKVGMVVFPKHPTPPFGTSVTNSSPRY